MNNLDPLSLGIALIVTGLLFWLAARFFLRLPSRWQPTSPGPAIQPGDAESRAHSDAVLVVRSGGRLVSINERTRQLFQLQKEDIADLERLSRLIRPSDLFLKLCAYEGQARFVVNGRLVEGTSYPVAASEEGYIVLTLRAVDLAFGGDAESQGINSQSFQAFNELVQSIATNLGLEETLEAILQTVEKLLPADFMEITIRDPHGQGMLPYRFTGLSGAERILQPAEDAYRIGEGYSGFVLKEKKPLLVSNISAQEGEEPGIDLNLVSLRSYLGIPLLYGEELVGILELGSLVQDTFQQQDLELLQIFSGQAAIALHNALLYRKEQRRVSELGSLAQLAQAFSSVRDPKNLFAQMVQSISPLIRVEVLGFLLYNEVEHALEGQIPFQGLPNPFIELYHAPIPPGSTAAHILVEQDIIFCEDPAEDPQ
ncbi:MAG: GAF domain-containing protein, partial [Anaerolineaceae bacterium]|nr:GAF domain-containing protein [Anaerolineaceae bacterium]